MFAISLSLVALDRIVSCNIELNNVLCVCVFYYKRYIIFFNLRCKKILIGKNVSIIIILHKKPVNAIGI